MLIAYHSSTKDGLMHPAKKSPQSNKGPLHENCGFPQLIMLPFCTIFLAANVNKIVFTNKFPLFAALNAATSRGKFY